MHTLTITFSTQLVEEIWKVLLRWYPPAEEPVRRPRRPYMRASQKQFMRRQLREWEVA